MTTRTSGLVFQRIHRKHAVAAAAAAAVSVFVHAAALTFLILHPGVLMTAGEPLVREVRSIRLEEVRLSEALESEMIESVAQAVAAGSPVEALAALTESLALPPEMDGAEPASHETSQSAAIPEALQPRSELPEATVWEPRQDILVVENRVVRDDEAVIPRRVIPRVPRTVSAADISTPIDRGAVPSPEAGGDEAAPAPAAIAPGAGEGWDAGDVPLQIGETESETGRELFKEKPEDVSALRPIENLLEADVFLYRHRAEADLAYFRVEIRGMGDDVLPVIPKDVVLVQDCSASLAEQRLYFCRTGMVACLDQLMPGDRLNVMRFRDDAEACFPEWQEASETQIAAAKQFIRGMHSFGETDIFSSMRSLLDMKALPGRPVIALVVTDGRATTGLTASSEIIGEFSKLNEGGISVFTMGTGRTANEYLLDLLSYCNRGASLVVNRGRWDIPKVMTQLMREISRPVLAGVRFRFAAGSGCDVYPVLTGNLFSDRPLVLTGRCPASTERIVFQATGRGGETVCDMVFDMPLAEAHEGNSGIRDEWARQKLYWLIGEYTRTNDPTLLRAVRATSRQYGIEVPYSGRF